MSSYPHAPYLAAPPPRPLPGRAPRRTGPPRPRPVVVAQAIASLGLTAGATGGGLLAEHVTGSPASAAAPLGALVLGAGLAAPVAGALMTRRGRRAGLRAGYLVGAAGAVLAVVAAVVGSLGLLLAGNLLLGAGNTAVMLSRYVVADLAAEEQRGRAIGRSLVAVAAGAVVGPFLLGPAGAVARPLGLPDAAGVYLLALVSLAVAAVAVGGLGKLPVAARGASGSADSPASMSAAVPGARRPRRRGGTALAALATANLSMVAIMAVLPVHLHAAGHGLGPVGAVVGIHVAAMYAASPLLGRIADRRGGRRLAAAGAVVLAVVGVLAAVLDLTNVSVATWVLALLGIGWNTQVVAGSALVTAPLLPADRPRAEARGEVAMSAAAAGGSLLLAPPLVAVGGVALLAAVTVPLHLGVFAALVLAGGGSRRRDTASVAPVDDLVVRVEVAAEPTPEVVV